MVCLLYTSDDGDEKQKADVNPGEPDVGSGEVVELSLLADPENAVGHDTHKVDEQARGQRDEDVAEVVLGVNGFGGGDAEVED